LKPEKIVSASRLSRTVLVLGLVSFVNDLSSEMIYPQVPLTSPQPGVAVAPMPRGYKLHPGV